MENNEKLFCSKCGAELEDDALFCSECGAPITKKEDVPQAESPKGETAPEVSIYEAESQKEAAPAVKKQTAETPTQEPPAMAASSPEASTEEQHKTEKTKTAPQAETPVGSAPPTASVVPVPTTTSTSLPLTTQKFCLHCGASLPMDAMFCQKCGTRQETQLQQPKTASFQPNGNDAAAQMNQAPSSNSINIDMEAFKEGVSKGGLNHVLLGVSILAGISVFLPLINVAGMANLKLMDISSLLSVIILVVAAGTAYSSMVGKYEIPVVTGHGFFLLLLFYVYKYQSKLSEMEANFWTALAKNAFRADWGFYLMLIAILGLIGVGLMASLQQTGHPTELNFFVDRWKQIMLQPVQIHTFKFQGIAYAIVIALLLIFTAMQSSGVKQLGL